MVKPSVTVICRLLIAAAVLVLCSCSSLRKDPITQEKQKAVLAVAASYLQFVAAGSESQLNSYVLWGDFLAAKDGMSRPQFRKQLAFLVNRWPLEEHPIYDLDLVEIDIKGSSAKVVLQRAKRPDFPRIWVKLIWSGNGWLVVDDSLFGPDALIETLQAKA